MFRNLTPALPGWSIIPGKNADVLCCCGCSRCAAVGKEAKRFVWIRGRKLLSHDRPTDAVSSVSMLGPSERVRCVVALRCDHFVSYDRIRKPTPDRSRLPKESDEDSSRARERERETEHKTGQRGVNINRKKEIPIIKQTVRHSRTLKDVQKGKPSPCNG